MWYQLYGYRHYNAAKGQPLDVQPIIAEQSKTVLPVSGILADNIKIVQKLLYGLNKDISDTKLLGTLRAWKTTVHKNGREESGTLEAGRDAQDETFARLIIGDLIRDGEDKVMGRATREHIQRVMNFVQSGEELPSDTRQTLWNKIKDASFFITEKGAIGLGSIDSEPGDEVWIFYGSNVPFTVRMRKGRGGEDDEVDRDFVGRSYVQGIMFGEIFSDKAKVPLERKVRLH
jgi:hypothetical protein